VRLRIKGGTDGGDHGSDDECSINGWAEKLAGLFIYQIAHYIFTNKIGLYIY